MATEHCAWNQEDCEDNSKPAFPVPHAIDGNWVKEPLPKFSGMSLRDYFAAQALPSLLIACVDDSRETNDSYLSYVARKSYEMADNMLAERAK